MARKTNKQLMVEGIEYLRDRAADMILEQWHRQFEGSDKVKPKPTKEELLALGFRVDTKFMQNVINELEEDK